MTVATGPTAPHQSERAAREQRTFRAVLDGMARPGTIHTLEPHPSGGAHRYAVTLLEAVLDHEVTFAVLPDESAAHEPLLRYTGSRAVPAGRADWLLGQGTGIASALVTAKQGDLEYPDRNATIVALVGSVSDTPASGERITLAGPGIRDTIDLWVAGFSTQDRIRFAARNEGLPLGIDLILLDLAGCFACLPRYTRFVATADAA